MFVAKATRRRLIGEPIIGSNPSVCDVFEVEVVVPRGEKGVVGWSLEFSRAVKQAVSVLTVIWSRGVSSASSAYSSGRREALPAWSFISPPPPSSGGGWVDIVGGCGCVEGFPYVELP
eukprot:scaffold2531_cov125-Isochrysis_galbana.AAC.3